MQGYQKKGLLPSVEHTLPKNIQGAFYVLLRMDLLTFSLFTFITLIALSVECIY